MVAGWMALIVHSWPKSKRTSSLVRLRTSSVLDLVLLVGQVQMSFGTLLGHHHHADDTTRATIPLDGLLQGALDKLDGVLLLHALFPVVVAVAVDVGRSGTADGVGLLVQRTAEGNGVDLTAVSLVPAGDDETRTEKLFVSMSFLSAASHAPRHVCRRSQTSLVDGSLTYLSWSLLL